MIQINKESLARVRDLLNQIACAQSLDAEINIIEALQSATTPALLRALVDAYDELQTMPPRNAFVFDALGLLVTRIEACGGSTELTNAVILASDLRQAIGNQWNKPDKYAADRVREAIGAPMQTGLTIDVALAAAGIGNKPASMPVAQPEPDTNGRVVDAEFFPDAEAEAPAAEEPPPEYSFDRVMAECLESLEEHDTMMHDPDPDERPSIHHQHEARFIRELIASHNELQAIKAGRALGGYQTDAIRGPSSTACDDQLISADDTEGGSHD